MPPLVREGGAKGVLATCTCVQAHMRLHLFLTAQCTCAPALVPVRLGEDALVHELRSGHFGRASQAEQRLQDLWGSDSEEGGGGGGWRMAEQQPQGLWGSDSEEDGGGGGWRMDVRRRRMERPACSWCQCRSWLASAAQATRARFRAAQRSACHTCSEKIKKKNKKMKKTMRAMQALQAQVRKWCSPHPAGYSSTDGNM